jgi:hypothetical protein
MTSELLELVLLMAGWLVAFLLGRELGIGFSQWRERRGADQDSLRNRDEA